MKLIQVEVHGFKSFANKVSLTFDGGVVGLVGPNGSGKSNINDAIKWVLGEQSSKSLRGSSMEDVIFAGSKTYKAMDFAEVSLYFDNSDGQISLPHKKLKITRKMKRGYGSEYFINDEHAKLKSIKEIAMESGISKSSLAIISQGTISKIAEATPEERRAIFEEAAGISKYKSRKNDALRKLEKTTEGLEKIRVVVNELERQVKPLEKQANKAKIFLEKSKKLESIEVALIVEDLTFFTTQLKELNSELEITLDRKKTLEEAINSFSDNINLKNEHKHSLENEIHTLNEKYQNIHDRLSNLELQNNSAQQKRQIIIDGSVETDKTIKIQAIKDELESIAFKINKHKEWDEQLKSTLANEKSKLDEANVEISNLKNEQGIFQQRIYKLNSQIEVLNNYKRNKSNLHYGVKTILNAQSSLSGILGMVADLIEVPENYESAISTVLKSSLQNIVVETSDDAVAAINFLKNNKGGRATFIPLNSIKPKTIFENYKLAIQSRIGFIDIASNLVSSKFSLLKDFLLGNVIVTKDIQNANSISQLIDKKYMVVSLDGDLVRVGGVMSGGETGNNNNSLLNMESQIEKLEKEIPDIQSKFKQISIEISSKENIISELQTSVSETYGQRIKNTEKLEISEKQFNDLKSTYESLTDSKLELNSKHVDLETELLELQSESENLKTQIKIKRNTLIDLNNWLSKNSLEKSDKENELRSLIDKSSEKINARDKAEFYIKNANERLIEGYNLTLENARENYKLEIDREEARTIVSEIKAEIKALGYVNVDSIEQYEEIKERYDKMKKSEEEIASAQQTILSAIDEMDQIIIKKFTETIKDVSKNLIHIFRKMFGGGEIAIKYTEPSNILETGVNVIAQPPGKAVKNLNLFSGGEKALIAISLLFAILKSKPLPLCLLDEVEAALDEANVIRYAEYLKELKDKTQFIVVTHRVGTMERVDTLFGATMQNKGVTSIFSVKLEKAKSLIDN